MSKVRRGVSERKVAANQSNAQKSTGPKTAEGKARASLNALKHGAYAKTDTVRRELMAQRGEDPAEYEQLHRELVESCQPDDVLQAMVLKTIGDKTWDKLRLRRALLETQLGSVQLAQARLQRRQLAGRRWPAGAYSGADPGLCGAPDSPDKFNQILEHLDRLQGWFEQETCPDEYPDVMGELYGEFPTVAGQQIRKWFIQLFDPDQAQCQQARQELPQWIAKEKSDVQQDRELYHRELALRRFDLPSTPEDQVAAKEAALERQIAEQTRLLLQLKSKRSLWGSAGQADASGGQSSPETITQGEEKDSAGGTGGATPMPASATITGGNGTDPAEGTLTEKVGQNGETKPPTDVESTA